jgi:tRNA-specific 2-thiouridylase
MKNKVVVAMSGGIDSSVAAYLLRERGWEVIGLTLDLYPPARAERPAQKAGARGGPGEGKDARTAAAALGIDHFVVDLRREFASEVVTDFCREYRRGRTPNPCIRCNERIKFWTLLREAGRLGADAVATGHYARVGRDDASGRFLLRKGVDPAKDQSYFLYALTQAELAAAVFPVGDLTKDEVRRLARRLGLAAAERSESQEICFVPDGDYAGFVAARRPGSLRPGPILDSTGRVLGRHRGIIHFTVGQRKGLGIAAPHPFYVLSIDPARRAVIVGPDESLYRDALIVERLNFVSVQGLKGPRRLRVKIRSRHDAVEALVSPLPRRRVKVSFARPQRAVTPGQSVVFYDGDTVLGGGIIREALD